MLQRHDLLHVACLPDGGQLGADTLPQCMCLGQLSNPAAQSMQVVLWHEMARSAYVKQGTFTSKAHRHVKGARETQGPRGPLVIINHIQCM